jgi:hypothetical protein
MMSILFFCCVLAIALPRSVAGQAAGRGNMEKEALRMLCQRWNTGHRSDSLQCFPAASFYSIDILPDGYINFSATRPVTGVWNFDAARNNLFILVSSRIWKYKIIALNRNELVLESVVNRKTVKNYLWRAGMQAR